MYRPVVIVGLKHVGKSSVGMLLSRKLSCPFFDTDVCISDDAIQQGHIAKMSYKEVVRELYKTIGVKEFAQREKQALQKTLAHNPAPVIATGGGIADNQEALHILQDHPCRIVYLTETTSVLFSRIRSAGLPLFLQGKDPWGQFQKIAAARNTTYQKIADIIFFRGGISRQETADALYKLLE